MRIRRRQFDLALIDLDLPGPIALVGDLARALPNLPFLALVTPQHLVELQEALLAGASGFVTFPIESSQFTATVVRTLQTSAARDTGASKGRLLAVTGLKRSGLAPEVPSVAELGYPQLESLAWIGLLAPANTPPAVIGRLSEETVRAMRAGEVRDSLGKQGFDVVASSPSEFSAWIRAEQAKWSKVIKASGATAD